MSIENTTTETIVLSRGQKAAATRAANKATRAAKVANVSKANAAKVPSKAARQRLTARQIKARAKVTAAKKARRENAAAYEASRTLSQQVKYLNLLEKCAKPAKGRNAPDLFALRADAIKANSLKEFASDVYAKAITAMFGPDCWNYKRSEMQDTPAGSNVRLYFAEQDIFNENFRAKHLAQGKLGKANPSAYWRNLGKSAQLQAATAAGNPDPLRTGKGNHLDGFQLAAKNAPLIYLRANKTDGFVHNEKLQKVARLAFEICELVGVNISDLQDKLGH
jgi:hypothetical protein